VHQVGHYPESHQDAWSTKQNIYDAFDEKVKAF
jgi:hypothetical protein